MAGVAERDAETSWADTPAREVWRVLLPRDLEKRCISSKHCCATLESVNESLPQSGGLNVRVVVVNRVALGRTCS